MQEVSLPSTQPIWRTIGIRNFILLKVCQVVETGLVDISFLDTFENQICLDGIGDIETLHITLGVRQNGPINQPLSVVLVTETCDSPNYSSAPVTITSK